MRKTDISVQELVGLIERGEIRLPEIQRRYVWRAPRVRDLLDSLYRRYPSGSILVWETDEAKPTRDLAVSQQASPFAGQKLLLDGPATSGDGLTKSEKYIKARDSLPEELRSVLDDLIEDYRFAALKHHGGAYGLVRRLGGARPKRTATYWRSP